jgi:pimeloyl-ACP methyl ester carboxylesterase
MNIRSRVLLTSLAPLLVMLTACDSGKSPQAPAAAEPAETSASERSETQSPHAAENAPPMKVEGRALSPAEDQEIAWSRIGDGAVTLIFVHGWQCDSSYWREQIGHFAADYRVVTLDLAGHGESDATRQAWSMEAFGADVAAVAEAAAGDGPVVLIGHSMGGPVILQAARRMDRVVGLVGVDTLRNVGEPPSESDIRTQLAPIRADYAAAAAALIDRMFEETTPAALRHAIRTDMLAGDPEIGLAMMAALRRMNYPATFAALTVPFVLINADRAPTSIEKLQTLHPQTRLVSIPTTGHFPMLEAPAQFNVLLTQVLEDILREAKMP